MQSFEYLFLSKPLGDTQMYLFDSYMVLEVFKNIKYNYL